MNNSFDHLLIYLSEKGRGEWNSFLQALHILEIEDSPYGIARRLCSLAHLDFDYLRGNKAWNVTTPALAMTFQYNQSTRAVLTGKRNPDLLKILEEQVRNQHASMRTFEQTRAPVAIEVSSENEEILALIAYQTGIRFIRQTSWAICLALPTLDSQVFQIPKDSGVFGEVDAFDFEQLRWKRLPREEHLAIVNGLFRYGPPFNRGHAFCRDGAFFRAEGEAGIWWWLRELGRTALCYNSARKELFTPFFADLPILWARALIMASGYIPEIRESQRVYLNIPLELARLVAEQLGQKLEAICD
jgi:hypothetical protein